MKNNKNCSANSVKTGRYFYLSNYYSSEDKNKKEDYKLFTSLSNISKWLNSKGLTTSASFSIPKKKWDFQDKTTLMVHIYNEDVEWTESPALFVEDIKSEPLGKKTYVAVDLFQQKVSIFTGGEVREINFKEFNDVLERHKFIEVYFTKEVLLGKGVDASALNFFVK
jgi:hypothetical protein